MVGSTDRDKVRDRSRFDRAVSLVRYVCSLSGSLALLDDIQADAGERGIQRAIERHDTASLFDWLIEWFSYQGVSDQVARSYMAVNGNATWQALGLAIRPQPSCPKLRSYWHYSECRYDKGSRSCAEPEYFEACPVPFFRLRNGRLNQTAFSFFLFIRDIADDDLVGWIDEQLGQVAADDPAAAVIEPLRHIYGLSDKVLTMALSGLLLAAPKGKRGWFEAGASMIAVDTLVHNFLHRTGILHDCDAEHGYGAACYRKGGCADIIRAVAGEIDATAFSRSYPRNFPRFVQHGIWQYCAADGANICNGNRIDDRLGCQASFCQISQKCQKRPLKIVKKHEISKV